MATAGLQNGHGFVVIVSWLNIRTKCCKACGTGTQSRAVLSYITRMRILVNLY